MWPSALRRCARCLIARQRSPCRDTTRRPTAAVATARLRRRGTCSAIRWTYSSLRGGWRGLLLPATPRGSRASTPTWRWSTPSSAGTQSGTTRWTRGRSSASTTCRTYARGARRRSRRWPPPAGQAWTTPPSPTSSRATCPRTAPTSPRSTPPRRRAASAASPRCWRASTAAGAWCPPRSSAHRAGEREGPPEWFYIGLKDKIK
mmetsp:Transcript_36041/g.116125  ORF Transcript_36041/g.116125 Transcript_36041/m.116125 type:complete len:204 (-) Transcript_36041:17-628(-)